MLVCRFLKIHSIGSRFFSRIGIVNIAVMTNRELELRRLRVESFLRKRQKIVNILGLEKELGFPIGTIQKFLNNNRRINDRRIKRIDTALSLYFKDWEITL